MYSSLYSYIRCHDTLFTYNVITHFLFSRNFPFIPFPFYIVHLPEATVSKLRFHWKRLSFS